MNSIKKLLLNIWEAFDDRTGTGKMVKDVALHPVPPGTGWDYAFGSATLLAFIIQVVTGIALATVYIPSTADAYQSLVFITADPLGGFLRGVHNWGASAMVLMVGLHALQVFLIGAYKFPREVNWLSGSVLLLLTIGMAFTGQLLRWDQTAFWSVIVAASQAARLPLLGDAAAQFLFAGDTINGATLSRFFAFHVFFIPALIFALVGLHLYLVLHNGISDPPVPGRIVDPKTYRQWYHDMLARIGEPFWPDALWRDVVFGVAMVVVIVAISLIFGAPELAQPPDPTLLNAYPRPDWYLLWYFAVLALMPPESETAVIILGPVLFGVLLFILPFVANKGERSVKRRPWALGVTLMIVLIISTFWILGERAPWSPAFDTKPISAEIINSTSGKTREGAVLFEQKGCLFCHAMGTSGGERGPDLTYVGDRVTKPQLITRILHGGNNMPAYAQSLTPDQVDALVEFLSSRKLAAAAK